MSLQESNEDIHAIMARTKAARDRLRKLAPQPQRIVNVEAAPIVPANPIIVDPFFAYARIINAVAENLKVSRDEIINGAPIDRVVQARKLVLALSVRFEIATLPDVAVMFQVTRETVTAALKVIDPILVNLAVTRRCPVNKCLPAILANLELEMFTSESRPTIADVQRQIALEFGITRDDLLSARRTREVVRPRQIAMAVAKALTLHSLPEIGRRFGGRDHTTVLHAVRKCVPLMREVANTAGALKEAEVWCRIAREKAADLGEAAFLPGRKLTGVAV